MNVGSILNEETPPSDNEAKSNPIPSYINRSSQRNSIVNLLNDEKTEPTPEPIPQPVKAELVPEEQAVYKNQEINGNKAISAGNDSQQRLAAQQKFEAEKLQKEVSVQPVEATVDEKPASAQLDGNNKVGTGEKVELNGSDKQEEDEITKLNKLKQKSKPKRYATPPIWAQEWIPSNRKNGGEQAIIAPGNMNESYISDKSIFNNTSTSSVDLECSITGVIPPPSVTRRIAEWIYANFVEVTEENRKHIELELKFGTIMDRKTSNRINILVSTECIYTDVSSIYFESGVHEVGFTDVIKYLDELERNYQEDLKNHPNKPRRKFNTLESDVTDSIYYVRNRNEQPKSIRISKDNALSPPRHTAINKQRISDLYIHNPSSMYDLRLSLSLENPVSDGEIEHIMKKSKPNMTRMKKRNSYSHRPTVTTFDLTRVSTPRELKNTSTGKKVVENENTFEVELEIDVPELFNGFDQFKNGTNSIRFEELVEIFVNNARCLNNRITKLAK